MANSLAEVNLRQCVKRGAGKFVLPRNSRDLGDVKDVCKRAGIKSIDSLAITEGKKKVIPFKDVKRIVAALDQKRA